MEQAPPGESRQGGPSRPKRSLQGWVGLVAAAMLAGLCISLALQRILPGPPPYRPRIPCAANLNGIGKAIVMYRTEHEDAFPPKLEVLISSVPWKMLRCPAVDEKMPRELSAEQYKRCDYFYLAPSGVPADVPGDSLMVCDLRGYHDDVRNVVYAPGNVRRLTEVEFQAELAKPVNAAFAAALRKAEAGAVDSRPASATSAPSTRPSSSQAASSEVNQER